MTLKKSGLVKTEVAVAGNHMTEPTTQRSTSPKRRDQPSGVSAVVLAQHLDCSRRTSKSSKAKGSSIVDRVAAFRSVQVASLTFDF